MKQKYLILLTIFFSSIILFPQTIYNSENVSSNGQDKIQLESNVHPNLTQNAYDLLINQYGGLLCSKLTDNLSTILTGSYNEDFEDIVYNNGNDLTTINHFWRADLGDNQKNLFVGNYHNNAYQKARVLIYGSDADGNRRIYRSNTNQGPHCIQAYPITGWYTSYESIFDFYTTGEYYWEGYTNFAYPVFQQCGPYYMGVEEREEIIWEILGRVTHLLGDMGVPAHAHFDTHIISDWYEDVYMHDAGDVAPYHEGIALQQGGLLDVVSKSDPLKYLFYTVNQVADFFGSDDEYGNPTYDPGYSELEEFYNLIPSPIGYENMWVFPNEEPDGDLIATHAYIMSMRAIAGLFYWFANETNMLDVTTSGTLQKDEVWGNVTLTGNVFVPSGKILTLCGGTIDVNGHYVKSIGGTIVIENGANGNFVKLKSGSTIKGLYPTIQTAISNASSRQNIILSSTTYNENLNMKTGVKVYGTGVNSTTINGKVTFSNVSFSRLIDVKVTKEIRDNYGSYNYLENVEAKKTIYFVHKNYGEMRYVESYEYIQHGLSSSYSNFGMLQCKIKNKTFSAIESSSSIFNSNFMQLCNIFWDVKSYTSTDDIYLKNCYFSSSSVGGSVSGPGISWSHWQHCGQLPKTADSNSKQKLLTDLLQSDLEKLSEEKKSIGKGEYTIISDEYRELRERMEEEKGDGIIEVKKYEKELNKIIYKFNNLSDKYPGTVTSLNSLREVVGCKRILGQSKSALEIVNKQEKTRGNSEIVSQIKLISLPLLLDEKDYEKALNLCDEIVRELPNSLEAPFMLLNKGMILEYFVEDKNKADEIYKELISRYPKSMYSNNAIELLGKDGEFERDNNKYSNEELFTTHDGFADIGSYPNPFNPSTTLNYYLQTASKVKLEVYDVMGRMIKSFTENSQASGSHKVVWDGTNSNGLRVATGIYIYRFEATSLETNEHFVKSEKLMLVK